MKINQIKVGLSSIKKENENKISENNDEIRSLEEYIKELDLELNLLKQDEWHLENILEVKASLVKIVKIFLAPFEASSLIALLVYMLVLATTSTVSLGLSALASLILIILLQTYYYDILPSSPPNSGLLTSFKTCLSELRKSKSELKEFLAEIKNSIQAKESAIKDAKKRMSSLVSINKELLDEKSYIEGVQKAVNILDNKYKIENISESTELAQFVGKRLTLESQK